MKKLLASGGLILASLAYVLFQHIGSDSEAAALPPVTTPQTPTPVTTTPVPVVPVTTPIPVKPVPTPTPTPKPTPLSTPIPTPVPVSAAYRDGSYTGVVADAYYGYIQVQAVISGGALTDVQILQYPNDRSTSRFINGQALPKLTQEAITIQTANVDTISGASDTSGAFRKSLSAALVQAKT